MELENLSSVNANTRRSTPVVINLSTSAFTFSTPASAKTAGVVSDGVAVRLASTSTATLFAGVNVSATRRARIRREKLSITVEIGTTPVEQADDGGVDVPHLVGASRSQTDFWLGRVHAKLGPAPVVHAHEAIPGRGRGADRAEPLPRGRRACRSGRGGTPAGSPCL